MKASELIAALKEHIQCCGDEEVMIVDGPSEIGKMDSECRIAMTKSGEYAFFICMTDWS